MDDSRNKTWQATATAVWRALRPAVPAVIGAAALCFLFAAVIPITWVAGISWNLYLDRLSDLFVAPIGNGGRLALALGMATIAAVLAGLVALLIAEPDALGLGALRRRVRPDKTDDEEEQALPRRRADLHPDDPPRPPIRAGRDLPAAGLGPVIASPIGEPAHDGDAAGLGFAYAPAPTPTEWGDSEPDDDALILADLAPDAPDAPDVDDLAGDELWLQPAQVETSAASSRPVGTDSADTDTGLDPTDHSLGAMVARLEAGLARRHPTTPGAPTIDGGATASAVETDGGQGDGEVDFALEAALGTLHRMNRQVLR